MEDEAVNVEFDSSLYKVEIIEAKHDSNGTIYIYQNETYTLSASGAFENETEVVYYIDNKEIKRVSISQDERKVDTEVLWTANIKTDVHTLSAKIDPDEKYTDADRTNNLAKIDFEVKEN